MAAIANSSIIIYREDRLICSSHYRQHVCDPVAKHLYKTARAIRLFFWKKYGLWGLDGRGNMHPFQIGAEDLNAQLMQVTFKTYSAYFRFHDHYAVQPRIVAHEYTHALIEQISPLDYRNQSGALCEHLADVFAIIFGYWYQDFNTWIVHARDFRTHVDVAHHLSAYAQYPNVQNDHGHVHLNSRIPNHAFYVAVQLLREECDGRMAYIWFQVLYDLRPHESFRSFAHRTIGKGRRLYGSEVALAIREAWRQVGVLSIPIARAPRSSIQHRLKN